MSTKQPDDRFSGSLCIGNGSLQNGAEIFNSSRNRVRGNGGRNATADSSNQDARRNWICSNGLGISKCHSWMTPTRLARIRNPGQPMKPVRFVDSLRERLHRVVQRESPGRTAGPRDLRHAIRGEDVDRTVSGRYNTVRTQITLGHSCPVPE